jgi:hypothetical protein
MPQYIVINNQISGMIEADNVSIPDSFKVVNSDLVGDIYFNAITQEIESIPEKPEGDYFWDGQTWVKNENELL